MANPVVTARVPEILQEALNAAALYTGRSVGDITREALALWLDQMDVEKLKKDLEQTIAERDRALQSLESLREAAHAAAIDFPGRAAS